MANKHYQIKRIFPIGPAQTPVLLDTVGHDDTSVSSPRVSGKLKLQSNPYELWHCVMETLSYSSEFPYTANVSTANSHFISMDNTFIWTPLTNKALARFTGKVRAGNASLGVTLASMKQSRDMIVDRSQKIASIFEKVEHRIVERQRSPGQKKRDRRKAVQDRAGDFLEWEFGWMPLVEDIKNSLGALGNYIPDRWISSSVQDSYNVSRSVDLYDYSYRQHDFGSFQVKLGANLVFDNPNLFLLNRLGLLNLPGVAWDLIPWSFVVNMFTNMGQMVNSVTDFVGCSVQNPSFTRSAFVTREDHLFAGQKAWQRPGVQGYASSTVYERQKKRLTGALPTPSLQLKLPELNLELAGIAISLILQKINRINKLFGMTP